MSHPTTETLASLFIGCLFITDRNWKQPRPSSTEELIKKIFSMYSMEYHSAIKNKILKISSKWMEAEKRSA